MRKFLLSMFTALMAIGFTGCEYDDSDLWNEVNSLKDRVLTLEQLCQQMNTNISSLQSLVSALQNQDYITSVTPIKQGNDVIGYTITFAKGEPITIYHGQNGKDGADGEDGKDGYTPVIGVDKAEDGVYYWTLDGEWLTDADGNKIPTSGKDGADGEDGEGGNGSMPELKIQGGYWYVSYDGGENWERLGRATGYDGTDGKDGAHGDSWFKSVEDKGDYVEFILKDGTVIVMPKYGNELELKAAIGGTVVLEENVVLDKPLVVAEGVELIIDLNGKKILGDFAKGDGAVITNNGKLTLEGDGTIENTAVNGDATINNKGELTLDGVTVVGAPISQSGEYPEYCIVSSGDLTIKDGTTVTADRGCLRLQGTGETVINGGTFTYNNYSRSLTSHVVAIESANNHLTINNGTFQHLHTNASGSAVICNMSSGNVEIKGGNFSGGKYNVPGEKDITTYGYGGSFSVTGGIFSGDVKDAFLSSGYSDAKSGDLWYVIDSATTAVANTTAELTTALTNGKSEIILGAGTYIIPDVAQGKTLTFVGTGDPEDTVIAAQDDGASEGDCDYSFDGSTVTFENVTITTSTTYFPGYARMKGIYKKCIINGVYTLYDNSTFEDCTFNVSGDVYNIWTWGAPTATFTRCTFNCDGKAMLLYGQANTKLTMNDCIFNDKGGLTDLKAAIEIGNDYGTSYELIVNNATVNGFEINDKGINTGTTLWANKNSMGKDKLNVVVDGVDVY